MKFKHLTYLLGFLFFLSCAKSFGNKKEFGNLEVFYSKSTPVKYVDGIGDYFKSNDLILDHKHSVKLTSDESSFILKMILDAKYDKVPTEIEHDIELLEADIRQEVFENLNFEIEICDANFYPIKLKN
ncbi:MAG: hypothetical protein ACWA41_10175 [Putridiphycobacter sp.]